MSGNRRRRLLELLLQRRQFFVYCVIGASGTLLDFAVYRELIHAKVFEYQAANVVSYASGTLLSFVLNAWLNFRVTDRIASRMVRFFGVALVGWSISALILHELVGVWGFDKYYAKAATLVVVVFVQYNLNRRFSFQKMP